MKGPIIFCVLAILYFAGLIALGLWTDNMPSGLGSMNRQRQPVAFWVSGLIWGVCAMIFLAITAVLLLPDD